MNVINTNIAAKQATYAMARNERLMSTAMERLSTGHRINSAKDDAAGLAISSLMKAVVSGLAMASKNANDGISMLEVAEGATLEISNMLMRMRELAVQSSSGTYSGPDRAALDLEFTALLSEIHRIASETTWNTVTILNGGNDATDSTATSSTFDIQLGANVSQKAGLSLSSWVPSVAIDMQAIDSAGSGSNGVDPRLAAGNVTEQRKVHFGNLTSGNSITVAGVTLTARVDMTYNEVARAFSDPSADLPLDGGSPKGSFDRLIYEGWTSGPASGYDVVFTSTTPDKDVANLSVSTTDPNYNPSYHWTTDGSPGATVEKNQSAYGDAVLYWNDNGSVKAINISTVESSQFAIDQLDKAILGVANERAKYGAYMSRLDHSSDNLLNVAQNTNESRSRIEDADYAAETSNLAKAQIILQASTAMLAQANQSKQTVLGLLQ